MFGQDNRTKKLITGKNLRSKSIEKKTLLTRKIH